MLRYSIVQRKREIGIRIAVGAQAGGIVRLVTMQVLSMVLLGAAAGITAGLASIRFVDSLFFQVKPTDVQNLAFPMLAIVAGAVVAALRPVLQAVRIDPASLLRAE